jgi:hypothetical protein
MCNSYARHLHGRNAQIILGADLVKPVEFVVCWTPTHIERGGTRLGMRLAEQRDIPVHNLAEPETWAALYKTTELGRACHNAAQ